MKPALVLALLLVGATLVVLPDADARQFCTNLVNETCPDSFCYWDHLHRVERCKHLPLCPPQTNCLVPHLP